MLYEERGLKCCLDRCVEFKILDDLYIHDLLLSRFVKDENFKGISLARRPDYMAENLLGKILINLSDGSKWIVGSMYGSEEELKSLNMKIEGTT